MHDPPATRGAAGPNQACQGPLRKHLFSYAGALIRLAACGSLSLKRNAEKSIQTSLEVKGRVLFRYKA